MYSIKEVADILGLSASTIRYYDKQGLLPFVERSDSGYRMFSEDDLGLLRMIECLKKTNMPIKEIRQFTQWLQQGDASLKQRHQMFLERRKVVEKQIEQLQESLKVIDYKCWYYETAIADGNEDKINAMLPDHLPKEIQKLYDKGHE